MCLAVSDSATESVTLIISICKPGGKGADQCCATTLLLDLIATSEDRPSMNSLAVDVSRTNKFMQCPSLILSKASTK